MTFDEFSSEQQRKGCSEVLVREWEPNQFVALHSHPFKADALIVQGEMWLITQERTEHLVVGDWFHLDAHTPHEERYGASGATYWVARTNV
jgi:quercetin dioxygenase-like cupin family protein